MTAAESSTTPTQASGSQTGDTSGAKAAVSDEQVRAIADQIYAMLLRDLRQERERDRISIGLSNPLRGGR